MTILSDRTFQYVDKTGDVEKAEQVVKKRRLEKERDKIYEDIRAARQNHNETEEARLNDGKTFAQSQTRFDVVNL